jgi:hypothetical protein
MNRNGQLGILGEGRRSTLDSYAEIMKQRWIAVDLLLIAGETGRNQVALLTTHFGFSNVHRPWNVSRVPEKT